jgi:enediyne biosynthesis protein E4
MWRICVALLLGGVLSGCVPRVRAARVGAGAENATATGPPLFRDITTSAGIRFKLGHGHRSPLDIHETLGHGAALLDVDGDGRLDIVLVGPDRCALYRNAGGGRFADITGRSGLRQNGYWMGCAAADYDNDGRTDLFVTGYGRCALYHNEGGRFRDVTAAAGVQDTGWSTSAGFADVDGDGRLDLYVARYVRFDPRGVRFCDQAGVRTACGPTTYDPERGRLFHNEGSGRFRDITAAAGLADAHGNALGVAFGDFDGDGRVDLAVANDQLPSDLFHNRGGGRFENAGVVSGIAYNAAGQAYAGMGIDWGDSDGDGRPDLVVATYQHEPRCLFRQDRPGLFSDIAAAAGLARATVNSLAFGVRFLDYDNDGWLDLAFANGHVVDNIQQAETNVTYRQSCQLFHNRGAAGPGRFEDVSASAGPDFTRRIVGRGLCAGDLDNDGRLDLLIVDAEGAPLLLHNEERSGHHWLTLRLVGVCGNRDGLGARLTLTAGGRSQTRQCFTDGSYMSASDPRVHFGLGTATHADEIVIRWPGGHVDTLRSVPADRELTVREGAPPTEAKTRRGESAKVF